MMDETTLKDLFESASARQKAIDEGLFTHFTNINRAAFEAGQWDFCLTGPFILHKPKGTAVFSSEMLAEMGMAGLFRCVSDKKFDALDPRMVGGMKNAYGVPLGPFLKNRLALQPLDWGWPQRGAVDTAAFARVTFEDYQADMEQAPLAVRTLNGPA